MSYALIMIKLAPKAPTDESAIGAVWSTACFNNDA